ncbi:mechanosensitive ion channel family protein [Phormidium pseudopriestleyi]|uniref:mechanosensitive ion channel family protein n=1 Tax=Phormidium pseudopriestleyi TaxID=1759527 RepID=UPI0030F40C12
MAASDVVKKSSEILTSITLIKLLEGAAIVLVAYLLIVASERFNNWLSEKMPRRFRLIVRQGLPFWRAAVILAAVISLMKLFLHLSPNNILALTGTISLALGFAFKDYARSLIAGVVALFEVPYRMGDRVQIGEHYGPVVSYGLRGIRLRTPTDNIVTIPHNKIWTDPISNANDGALEAQVVTDFYLAHNVDIDRVMKILYQAAYTSQYTQLKLPIMVMIDENPWATHFMLKCYPIDARDEFIYKTDLLKRSKETFRKYGIAYPSVPAGFEEG